MSGFTQYDRMRFLIKQNPALLPVLSRFNISLGFGDSTVADVCNRSNVDVGTFLAVCNFIAGQTVDIKSVDLPSLVEYLKNAHRYFLDYVLPGIRTRLISALTPGEPGDFAWMLIKFYDEYVLEVKRHTDYEDEKIFSYVLRLSRGVRDAGFSIGEFKDNHLAIADKLRDIKELFIGHYTADAGRVDMLNSVLFDIITCENDLMMHCALEDKVFVPAVEKLEKHSGRTSWVSDRSVSKIDEKGDIVLTPREKEIVKQTALGLSCKEIADKLFLSVHTVTTHRRNISSKLNIHSPQGLTIYALMHGIITLEELKD